MSLLRCFGMLVIAAVLGYAVIFTEEWMTSIMGHSLQAATGSVDKATTGSYSSSTTRSSIQQSLSSKLSQLWANTGSTLQQSSSSSVSKQATSTDTYSYLQLEAGELPGYTGWARPEQTLAGCFVITGMSSSGAVGSSSGNLNKHNMMGGGGGGGAYHHNNNHQDWWVTVQCQNDVDCHEAASWFFVRAYGPAVVTSRSVQTLPDAAGGGSSYKISIRLVDPGRYTIEVILTHSNAPLVNAFPLLDHDAEKQSQLYYEGYLLPGFPLQVTVAGRAPNRPKKLCTATELVDTAVDQPYDKARWIVTDTVRSLQHHAYTDHHQQVNNKQASTQQLLRTYQYGLTSLGIMMQYEYHSCQVIRNPKPLLGCFSTSTRPLHIVMIGDSALRVQKELLDSYIKPHQQSIRVTFIELYGGTLRCARSSGPFVRQVLAEAMQHPQAPSERTVVLVNTGLHDIHRLCGDEWKEDRTTYLSTAELTRTCTDLYKVALRGLLQDIYQAMPPDSKSPDMVLFQTTSAAWPKYGNYGINWNPARLQTLPLDAHFVHAFNKIAVALIQSAEFAPRNITLVDGYWVSLPRPDHREVNSVKADLGKKLSHPGIEVVRAMVHQWITLVLVTLCV